jgi:hypothetical protein
VAVEANIKIAGVKDAIRTLNKIEPGMRKEFRNNVQAIAQPVLNKAAEAYKFVPISGLERTWAGPAVRGRKVAPLTLDKARRGLKVILDTRSNATASILIQQNDAGWAIFETAGRKTTNSLGTALGPLSPGKTRLFGRVVYGNQDLIAKEIEKYVLKVVNDINGQIRIRNGKII